MGNVAQAFDETSGPECDYSTKKKLLDDLMKQFDEKMAPLTAKGAMEMSTSEYFNDLYLARAYPFLYARKLGYAARSHWWGANPAVNLPKTNHSPLLWKGKQRCLCTTRVAEPTLR